MKANFKTIFITSALVGMSLNAMAQRNDGRRGPVRGNLNQEIAEKAQRIQMITERIERNSQGARRGLKMRMLARLDAALDALRPGGGNQGGGHFPPSQQVFNLSGTVDHNPINFQVVDSMDLVTQCLQSTSTDKRWVTKVRLSMDFGPTENFDKRSSFVTKTDLCIAIAENAITMGLPAHRYEGFNIVGRLGNTGFEFQANNLAELNSMCLDFMSAENLRWLTRIITFDGVEKKDLNHRNSFMTAMDTCNALIQLVR